MTGTVNEMLADLGVGPDTLTDHEREALDRDGFCNLGTLLRPDQIEAIRVRLDELVAAEGDRAGLEVHQEDGTNRLSDVCNKGAMFDVVWCHPRLLAAVAHVLHGNLKLSSLNFRAPLPGHGHQGLHVDWSEPVEPGDYSVCNSFWCIDDIDETNGPPRVVVGSHRSRRTPRAPEVTEVIRRMLAPGVDDAEKARLQEELWEAQRTAEPGDLPGPEVVVKAAAGEVVVVNSHVWHGGTANTSGRPRRIMHCYWTRRELPQQLDQRAYIRPETLARISAAQRWLLDV